MSIRSIRCTGLYAKHAEVDKYVKTVMQFIQERANDETESTVSNPASSINSQDLSTLLQQLVGMRFDEKKLRCPKWKQNQSIDEYIILLSDWIDQAKLQVVPKFQQIYEALQDSPNDQVVNMLSNFLLTVRPLIDQPNVDFKETVIGYLRQRFGRNSLYRSVETWSEISNLTHDPNNTENFLDQFKLLIQRCDQNNLKIPEPIQVAMLLSKLNVDQATFKNITSVIDDVGENNALKNSIAAVRKFCLLPSNISKLQAVNYVYRREHRSSERSGDRSGRKFSRSSRDSRGRDSKSRSKSHDSRKSRGSSRDSNYRRSRSGRRESYSSQTYVTCTHANPSEQDGGQEQEPREIILFTNILLSDIYDQNLLIVDSGAPSSIMPYDNVKQICKHVPKDKLRLEKINKSFKFGPSRIYNSRQRITLPLKIFNNESVDISFFILDLKNVPNLLGSDQLDKLKAKLNYESKTITLKDADIPLNVLNSGHLALPFELTNLSFLVNNEDVRTAGRQPGDDGHRQHSGPGSGLRLKSGEDALWLTEEEAESVAKGKMKDFLKLHRMTGHTSANQLWKFLKNSSRCSNRDRKLLKLLVENCQICKLKAGVLPRPKACMTRSTDFNELVSWDLKDFKNKYNFYILYCLDEFSKLIVGKIMRDKRPQSVIENFEEVWVYVAGHGFGWPRQILSDNGGEFINSFVCEYLLKHDVKFKSTASYAPWSNGSTEKRHHIVDDLFESAMLDNPLKLSPQQLLNRVCFYRNCEVSDGGFSPLQVIMGRNPALFSALNFDQTLDLADTKHEQVRRILELQSKIRSQVRTFNTDRRLNKILKMRANKNTDAVFHPGQKILFYDPVDRAWRKGTLIYTLGKTAHVDVGGQSSKVDLTRLRDDESYNWECMLDECVRENDDSEDLPTVFTKFQNLNDTFDMRDYLASREVRFKSELEELEPSQDGETRLEGRPQVGDSIAFRFTDKNWETTGKVTKVGSRSNPDSFDVISAEGIFKYLAVGKNIHYWRFLREEQGETLWIEENSYLMEAELLFPITLTPKQQLGIPEVEQAKQEEIKKWYNYKCFSIIKREGYMRIIPLAWVVNKKCRNVDEKVSNVNVYKARLVVRGDLEGGGSRTDSPTAPKEIMRLILAVSTLYNFDLATCDISSAFLQSSKPDRDIFLRPPDEWTGDRMYVWKAEKGIYGLKDASRLWFIRFRLFLDTLKVESIGDSESCFISRARDGKIRGFILTHVDDILIAGSKDFLTWFEQMVRGEFVISKIKYGKFRYTGLDINSVGDKITIDQNFKLQELSQFEISEFFGMGKLDDKGIKTLQRIIGQLGWLASQTRPDLAFGTLYLSIIQRQSSFDDLKEANKLLQLAKENPLTITLNKLSTFTPENLQIWDFTDASHAKLESGIKSSEGRFVFLINETTRDAYVINWRAAMISQVCNSAKAAETHAVRNAGDELVYYSELFQQIFNFRPKIYIFTDSKSLKDSIYSTTLVKEKSLRICIANIKQWIKQKIIKALRWVDTKNQIADVLTKAKAPTDLIRIIFQNGKMPRSVYNSFQAPQMEVDADTLYMHFFESRNDDSEESSYRYVLMHEGLEI